MPSRVRLCRQISAICLTSQIILPIATLLYWACSGVDSLSGQWTWDLSQLSHFTMLDRVCGAGLSALAVVPLLFALQATRDLLGLYSENVAFSEDNVSAISRIGHATVLFGLAQIFIPTLIPLALTIGNEPGHRLFVVSSSSVFGVEALIVGGLLMLIAGVTEQARHLANENALTI